MRLVTWNCRMAYDKKAHALAMLEPDVAVVPESADPGAPPTAHKVPHRSGSAWVGPNRKKGLSLLSFGDYRLEPVARHGQDLPDALAARVTGPLPFTLVGVWTRAPTYIRRMHDVLDAWGSLLREGQTVVAGDFNSNTIWDKLHGTKCHSALVRRLDQDFNLFSAYHATRGEAHGAETTSTFFMYGQRKLTYHIDYVFLPKAWRSRLTRCEVGHPDSWLSHSDHCPMVVDVSCGLEVPGALLA